MTRSAAIAWWPTSTLRCFRLYAQFGLADRTQMEYFNGGHTINGQGTFEFLARHLA